MLTRIAFAAGGLLVGAALLLTVEILLRALDLGDNAPRRDPFAGFSSVVPVFERGVREDGTPIYQLAASRRNPATLDEPLEPQRTFLAEPDVDPFRIFVVGGSTAQGVPYPTSYAFSGWLERRLRRALPDVPIEVVNAALSGYASRRLLPVVREIVGHSPDLLVVYMGHNEWAERQYYAHLVDMDPRLFRAWEWLVRTHLYGLLSQLLGVALLPSAEEAPEIDSNWRDNVQQMFAVLDERAAGKSYPSERDLAYRDLLYEHNLREIARLAKDAGSALMLLTLSQNFSDWPPGASTHRKDLEPTERAAWNELSRRGDRLREERGGCAAAIAAYSPALEIDGQFADLHYRLARCHHELGDLDAARRHYRLASDLDRVPHGTPTRFNGILSRVAREYGALLVDVDGLFSDLSGDRLVGSDLFVDFIHPNLLGHQKIAAAVAAAMRDADMPVGAERWRELPLADPEPESLYREDPALRVKELEIGVFACRLARRPECALEAARALAALDPNNAVARSTLADSSFAPKSP